MVKLLFTAIGGAAIYAAQVLDEKATVPLFTTVSVVCTMLVFTWTTARKLQVFIDRLQKVEGGNKEMRKEFDVMKSEFAMRSDTEIIKKDVQRIATEFAASISALKLSMSEMSATMTELRTSSSGVKNDVRELRDEWLESMERLRGQMKTGSMMEAVPGFSGMKVLIVDDNDSDVDILRRKLAPTFMVDSCGTLREAHMKLARNESDGYDCVLLDLKLPDSRIASTVEDFVARNPDKLCIVVTGMRDEAVRQRCFEQGADDVWVKGIDDNDLRSITRRLKEAIWRRHRRMKP
jgi:CheY-like chemotaxis protein